MLSIHLHKLLFYCYHGVHEEEKLVGGEFEVNVTIDYQPLSLPVKHIKETIDYVSIYEVVKKRMASPTELLETIVTELATEMLAKFPLVEEAHVSITKLNPPITSMQGSVGVSFTLKRKQ